MANLTERRSSLEPMIFEFNNKTYLEEVLELVNESVVVLSKNMEVVRFTKASKELFGAEDLAGYSLTAFIHPEDVDLFEKAFRKASADCSSTPLTVEYRTGSIVVTPIVMSAPPTEAALPTLQLMPLNHRGHDSYGWVKSTLCKIEHRSQTDVHVVTRSIIDERRELNEPESKVKASEEPERINAAKLRYISCVAHELNTPVSSFCLMLDLLQHTVLSAEQQELVQQGAVATDMMKLTICQTMDITKALTGAKLQPLLVTVDLSKILKRANLIINGFGKQVPVTFEVAADVRNSVLTDEEWLRQMLLSLLTNACKYTSRGSIRVVVSLSGADPVAAAPMLRFDVIDTGIGVSDANLTIMFKAYTQLQESQMTGTGLGLFGLRTRAEWLQGTCGAHHNLLSCTGTGTVVWFSIPYVPETSIDEIGCPTFCVPPHSLDSQTQLLPGIPLVLQEAERETAEKQTDVLNCSRKHNAEQLISTHKLVAEELISTRKVAAEELISISKLIAEELISINKLIAEELIRSDILVAEELISSEKLTAEEKININKLTAEELISSDKLIAKGLSSSHKLSAEELICSDKRTAEKLINSRKIAAEEQMIINKLTAMELIGSNKLIAEGLNNSNKLTADGLSWSYKRSAEELINSGKVTAEERIAEELISSGKLIAEELISSDKLTAEELIWFQKLTAENLSYGHKLAAEELIISNMLTAVQLVSDGKLTAEEQITSNKLTADWLSCSYKLTAEELISSEKLTAEEKININKLTAEELISCDERTAEKLISSGKLTAEEQTNIKLIAMELIDSNKLIAEGLNNSNKLAADGLSWSYKRSTEELINNGKVTAEELISSNERTAEELISSGKLIAEELISSDKLTAEELICFQKLTAENLSYGHKLAAEELIISNMLTAVQLVSDGKLTAKEKISISKLTAEELNIRRKRTAEELISNQKLAAEALICSDKLTAETLVSSDKLIAEELINSDKLTAEELINSDKLTAEELINSDMATAVEIIIKIKLTGAELIRSRKLTAMVVEDTLTVRKLMQKLLLSMGFERVDCYEDGSKGLDAMMTAPVDIVFSDIQMPIMGGSEMVRRLRQLEAGNATSSGARQLVIAVTANASGNEMCGPDGFDQICSKPLSMKEIYKIVDTYCLCN